jgi:hypothetical protein
MTAISQRAREMASIGWWTQSVRDWWSRPEHRWLAAIMILAAVLRIVWVLFVNRGPQGLHDPTFYYVYASQIADGHGYRLLNGEATAYYPVGYPAALGGVFALLKHTWIPNNYVLANGYFQVFLGSTSVGLIYIIGRRLFTPGVGLLAALWIALFPNLIYHSAAFLSETLFMFLVLAALAVLLHEEWRDGPPGRTRLLAFGVVLGLSALVRPISLLFLPLLAVVWLYAGYGWRRALEGTALALVATATVIAPWTIRNVLVFDAPVIISTNLGDDLCMGHYPGAYGGFSLPDDCFDPEPYEGLSRPEFERRRNDDNVEKAIKFAVRHPRGELKLLSSKSWYLWNHDHDGLNAVESYGDDPFIRTPLSLQVIPGRIPDDQLATIASRLHELAGLDANDIIEQVSAGKQTAPETPIELMQPVEPAVGYEIKTALLPGVRLVTEETAGWKALMYTADIYFFVTISLGGLGLVGLVLQPRDPRRLFYLLAILAFAGIPLVFFGDARFHIPALVLLVVASAWAVTYGWQNKGRLIAQAAPSGAVEGPEGERPVPDEDALQDP